MSQRIAVFIRNHADAMELMRVRGVCAPWSVLSSWFGLSHRYWTLAIQRGTMTEIWVDGVRWGLVEEAALEHKRLRSQFRAPEFREPVAATS